MKKIIPILALLLFAAGYKMQAQCTPVNCIANLPAYGGICDTLLINGRVNTAYSDFESFVLTSSCFDAGLIDPGQAGNSIKITNVDNFTYTGLPTGITAATNANSYTPPNNGNIAGCVRFQGTPTQIGVFKNTINFLADVRLCTFPFISLNNNAAGYGLRMTVLPDPTFTGLASTYCVTDANVTLTVTGTTGGTFSGAGISGTTFSPATAGAGTYTIKYKVSRQEGAAIAAATDSMMVTVTVLPASFSYYVDGDNDGYGVGNAVASCASTPPVGYAALAGDCNDANAAIRPNATEVCDGIDNNCAGGIDEGLTLNTYYLDTDNDGFGGQTTITSCAVTPPNGYSANSGDCNDNNAAINPNATEVCDGVDNNCVGGIDEGLTLYTYYLDNDNDNFGSSTSVTTCAVIAPTGYVVNNGDCNDANAAINPGATEVCDGIDNNCAGGIDEGLTFTTYYVDNDGDGYGTSTSISSCQPTAPIGYVAQSGDCNDNNNAVNPGATEICDGVDNNCAGGVDNGLTFTTYYLDSDGDGYGSTTSISSCQPNAPLGYANNNTDCNDADANINPGELEIEGNSVDENCDGDLGAVDADNDTYNSTIDCDDNNNTVYPGAPELCDGIDNNCVGGIDEGLTLNTYYLDADNDGYGSSTAITTCQLTPPTGYVANNTDCNDGNASINPGITEVCDGVDNNCAGGIDDGLPLTTYYLDADNDGYGSLANSIVSCAITAPNGYVATGSDCNDANANINPGTTEVCDGVDNNCGGGVDEGLTLYTYYLDGDNDTYGSSTTLITCANTAPNGYVAVGGDCNDANANINPGATEICDGIDNNCTGGADEGLTINTYYLDGDNDGYGSSTTTTTCSLIIPTGYVAVGGDCNDANAAVHPNAAELCNGQDDNCDNNIDEGLTLNTYYLDFDNDTYGSTTSISSCANTAPTGYVTNNTDCNDNNAAVHPGATEVCDGIDNNCAGGTDEGLALNTYYRDLDTDGYGNTLIDSVTCALTPPVGYVLVSGDCDDSDVTTYPGANELCDGLDNDCNNDVDDGLSISTFYRDFDTDGFGDITQDSTTCAGVAPTGYVSNNQDCNDANLDIYPGGTEIPNNGIDEDCNGSDLTIGLNTVEAQFGINLFPNPASEFIVLSGKLNDNLIVTIYDLQGKQLMSRALTQGTNYTLDITSLKAGYYMMEISNKTTAQRGFTRIVLVK